MKLNFLHVSAFLISFAWALPVLAQTTPTNYEQYQLELLNRARANPNAEVTRLSGMTWGDNPSLVPGTMYPEPQTPDLNEGLPAGTISAIAKPPLAFNLNLQTAARNYSQTLIANNAFTHTYNGTDPGSRMTAAGYSFTGAYGYGENLAVSASSSSSFGISTSVCDQQHDSLFIDNNTTGRGHRINMMDASYREVGLGLAQGSNYTFLGPSTPYAVISTYDFAYSGTDANPFLTGVVYNDNVVHDSFYTPGEGIGNVTITATPTGGGSAYSTTTWSSGGYSLELPPGNYNVTATDPGVYLPVNLGTVTIGSSNVKMDAVNLTPVNSVPAAPPWAFAVLVVLLILLAFRNLPTPTA